jgi:hypothetical protein
MNFPPERAIPVTTVISPRNPIRQPLLDLDQVHFVMEQLIRAGRFQHKGWSRSTRDARDMTLSTSQEETA